MFSKQYIKFGLQFKNILFNFEEEVVIKFLKSKDINELHPLNKFSIVFTEEVSKFFKYNDIIELQPENIFAILVTDDVSKLLKSKDSSF